jgi:hypothetical protein
MADRCRRPSAAQLGSFVFRLYARYRSIDPGCARKPGRSTIVVSTDHSTMWTPGKLLLAALPPASLGGVLVALVTNASRDRWLPVAAFLATAVVAEACFLIGRLALRRRTRRLKQVEVPFGAQQGRPLWLSIVAPVTIVGCGAAGGAIAAAVSLPRVGIGVLLIFCVVAAVGSRLMSQMSLRALTFEAAGLRLHVRGGSCVVPWKTIAGVGRAGPDHMQIVELRLTDTDFVMAAEPRDDRVQSRIRSLVRESEGARRKLILMPWTGGLDGLTIARTVGAAVRRTDNPTDSPNRFS